ncbi:MAG: DUF4345 family protein [Hyphomonadaceae bacterium]
MFGVTAWDVSAFGLMVGAGLGLAALINPRWAAKLVKLEEAAPGGASEFRATYGGLFFAVHAAAWMLIKLYWGSDNAAMSAVALGGCTVLAAGWAGSCFGRIVSFVLDKTATKFMLASAAFEAAMALIIAAPWFYWVAGALFR